ncbi:MAG: 3' terminal RNA ribose 2'-O-methyltransferase Hen1 [Planctomycetes bacterium]|nr:3' terminal RNA ribose 2'-O-methyltransferase Hen1 [Planctomycetota bacterium]
MLLTISTTHCPATDLGYLLHKNPARCQTFELSFGRAHVFYPEATTQNCTAALLLDVDPVGIVRGPSRFSERLLDQYVNDRPFVASSFLSVAIAQVFGSALQGRSKERPELVDTPLPLVARIAVLPCRGGEAFLRRVFESLGYALTVTPHPLDETFPDWGESPYFTVELSKTTALKELLTHLYVLVPVFDHRKHYYVGQAEMENLLAKGEGWLSSHPEREAITFRYLKQAPSLARQALAQLAQEDEPEVAALDGEASAGDEDSAEARISLNEERLGTVLAALRATGARRVLDLGCGEGNLVRELMKDKQFDEIVGLDVSIRSLEIAADRLRLDRLPPHQKDRVRLLHGSLMYRDRRLEGFDAAAVVEVIEHLDPPRLAAFERVLFECARPGTVVLTTPNREYNVLWARLAGDAKPVATTGESAVTDTVVISPPLRHKDHRFEWTRAEFRIWAEAVAERFGYTVRFLPVGPEDPTLGPPTQMAVFERE